MDRKKLGKANRQKGYRVEHKIVNMFNQKGLKAIRVPLSGGTQFQKGDIIIGDYDDKYMIAEVKSRKEGFGTIYKFLGDNDLLIIHTNRKEPLVVMSFDKFVELARTFLK